MSGHFEEYDYATICANCILHSVLYCLMYCLMYCDDFIEPRKLKQACEFENSILRNWTCMWHLIRDKGALFYFL